MKKVLIIGAGFLQDFVIQKAKAIGYDVYTLDMDPNAIGFQHADHHAIISIVDEKACLEYARKEKIDGVLTAATDYGVLTTSFIAQEMGLPGLKYDVAKIIKNKYMVRKALFEHHVDDTEQAYAVDANTDLGAIKNKIQYPVMVKPCDGSGSRAASRVDESSELASACQLAMNSSMTHRAVIESFINGNEYGADSIVVNGEIHVLAIMKKWMTNPPYYAELGHGIPCGLSKDVEARAKECVHKAIRALGINHGSVNMDMLITKEGKIHIVDVGARMGGNLICSHVIPLGTGIDYMKATIQNAVGDPVDLSEKEHCCVATRLLAFSGGIVCHIPLTEEIEQKFHVEIQHHLTLGQKVNEYHTNLDGCGYIIANAKTVEIAQENAMKVWKYYNQSLWG